MTNTDVVQRLREAALADPDAFWADAAARLPWLKPWEQVFVWEQPSFRWFVGGETNLAYSALDRHVDAGRGEHVALLFASERGERRSLTYRELLDQVVACAAALRGMGIERGDRLTIYMPTTLDAIVLMLATVRIGAIHSVVFAGFGSGALADRVNASGSKLIFTADLTSRKGKDVPLKGLVDGAMALGCPTVERVVVLQRGAGELVLLEHDINWDAFLARGAGHSGALTPVESNEPAFILATSGTTAKPKLAVHRHGGYQVQIHSMGELLFALRPDDIWWSTSDIGWIVGHSYMVYAPLIFGCTSVVYEGAIDYPQPGALWQLVEELKVTGLFTSPTAVRLMMRYGEQHARAADLSSLERVFCAGEVLNAPAWEWLQKTVLNDRIPVIDHMWQTETGGPIIGNPYGLGLQPIKPGSSGMPLPGIDAVILTPDGEPCGPNEKGIMAIRRPFPGLIASLWGEPERYGRDYWSRIEGVYSTGDSAMIDADGYVWFAGRADEIIKIAAHRIGTVEVETAFLKHPAVAEAGATGRPDDLRGEVIAAFIVLRNGYTASDELRRALLDVVRLELGPIAVIGELEFVNMLPKTRSGKIMRRVLKAVTLGKDPGDITTIEDEGSVEEARQAWQHLRDAVSRT
ncbi:MAG: acetate--CoA ligase [Roseiflexaceae bacterium]|nr:acetate--CoA ligase [Roseiflexaceae bacterium]